ncbi:MAG: hypothetical protein ACOYOE_12285 [Chlorobium sp.]
MLKAELFEVVANGENSGVEFKRDVEVLSRLFSTWSVAVTAFQ